MTGKQAFALVQQTGRSQAEIARLLGVSPMAVQKWRNGHPPSEPVATLLALFRERPEVMDVVARMKGLTS
ncbi:MAG: hypothetical protein CTY28_14570 [Hyphomicrobium sp.]|nr:MAG: hypothetical protein CTY28_14570 [Hyphomicrobium sp.]